MDSLLPVILLTAKDDLATRSAAIALGASEFIAKPVNIDDLLTRVRTHVAYRNGTKASSQPWKRQNRQR